MNVHHSHVFWLCPRMAQFWEGVHLVIVRILGYNIPQSCKMLYFGILTGNVVLRDDRYLLKILLAACKKAITKRWYKPDPPTQNEWLKIVRGIHDMELLTHRIRSQEQQCQEKWKKWTLFIGQNED